jgi:tetratricopeptide (TPR) repeat protein
VAAGAGTRSFALLSRMYNAGVEAAERAIGERAFKEDVGHFWGLLETRPYMRARAGLASCLWQLGEREQAVVHYCDMLRLNPNDNQGIRYTLLGCFLEMGSDDQAADILDDPEYADDATATWPYSRALLTFRRKGPGEAADALLSEAQGTNPHVPAYLLGKKRLPEDLPHLVGFGDESEAIVYAADHLEAWRSTPGASNGSAPSAGATPHRSWSRRCSSRIATWS